MWQSYGNQLLDWRPVWMLQWRYFLDDTNISISSVQFSDSVMSNFLWPHGLQHARLPCPSPTPGACSNSHPSSQWCHSTISSSVIPFSSCLQSFPASGSFQWVSSFLQVTKVLDFSFSISSSNEYSGRISFRIDWFDLLEVQGTPTSLLQHHSSKSLSNLNSLCPFCELSFCLQSLQLIADSWWYMAESNAIL